MLGWLWAAGNVPAELELPVPTAPVPAPAAAVQPAPRPEPDAAPGAGPAADGDLLKFTNGDLLHGAIVDVKGSLLRWRRADVQEPIAFNLDNVLEMQFAPRPPRTTRTPHRLAVELTNGDRLAGDLVALDGRTLKLITWYAGPIELKRAMVQRIVCQAAPQQAIFAGPTSLAGWTLAEGSRSAWKYKNGAFYCLPRNGGGVGRNVNLPDLANIEFDLAWRGQLYFQVGFYFSNLNNLYSSGGYMLQFNHTSVYLNRTSPNRGANNMGSSVEVPKLQTRSKTHVALRVNKAKKTIALFLDGELVKQWTDGEDFAGSGRGMIFFTQGQSQMRLANILVTAWDGRLDSETAAAAPGAEDLVRFANGDKLSGAVTGIAHGEAAVAASFGEMKVPLERIAQIEFTGQKAEKPRRRAADVRATFLDGSRFTLALEQLDGQSLVGASESCGRVTTALDAFTRVQFHIYEARPEAADDDWDGAAGGDFPEERD